MTDSKPSKSERKREAQALKDLGDKLLNLSEDEFASLELDERLVDAIATARRIRSREALRRQKAFIAKLLMNVDTAAIRELIEARESRVRTHNKRFQAAERWRDRLAREGGAALEAFETHIDGPATEVRERLAELNRASTDRAEKGARKALFRAIFDALDDAG